VKWLNTACSDLNKQKLFKFFNFSHVTARIVIQNRSFFNQMLLRNKKDHRRISIYFFVSYKLVLKAIGFIKLFYLFVCLL
jgi:hypothetical protein